MLKIVEHYLFIPLSTLEAQESVQPRKNLPVVTLPHLYRVEIPKDGISYACVRGKYAIHSKYLNLNRLSEPDCPHYLLMYVVGGREYGIGTRQKVIYDWHSGRFFRCCLWSDFTPQWRKYSGSAPNVSNKGRMFCYFLEVFVPASEWPTIPTIQDTLAAISE